MASAASVRIPSNAAGRSTTARAKRIGVSVVSVSTIGIMGGVEGDWKTSNGARRARQRSSRGTEVPLETQLSSR